MEGGRYVLQQGERDYSSALENYDANHDSDLRGGAGYAGGFLEGGYERERGYPRDSYPRDILYDREVYGMGPAVLGLWPPAKRRNIEDELAILREVHRHGKGGYVDNIRDYGYDRAARCSRERDSYDGEEYEYVRRSLHGSRDNDRDVEFDYPTRHRGSDSDRERSWRERDRRQRKERDWNRSRSRDRDRDWSPHEAEYHRDRHRSRSVSDERSRSRSHRSHSHGWREDSMEDVGRQEPPRTERRRDREGRSSNHERTTLAPSATLVVKGLSQKTVEDDIYHALADWGPLRHVRVIKERSSGVSRGFAFVDFPSMEAAQKMMEGVGYDGLIVDGRRLFFEYSSKPTGGLGTQQGVGIGRGGSARSATVVGADWMCTVCGCVNFARRILCFQCNEGRADDAPAAEVPVSTVAASGTRRGSEAGPTHVLVVRGLEENIDEEILRFEFSKHAPIKDLRLVRDKFSHVSRGFAFIHFNTVQEATKALEASNGTTLGKNGQLLRVAFAKSIYGPGSSATGVTPSQGSQAAAAAIEAATFAQQYDNTGWAPKEYNPDQDLLNQQSTPVVAGKDGKKRLGKGSSREAEYGGQDKTDGPGSGPKKSSSVGEAEAPQSGFVWDEASGYYYDAASGFYYDGHRGLYYDGNTGFWYTYDQETQQYAQYVDSVRENIADGVTDSTKIASDSAVDGNVNSKAVISAPASVSLEAMGKKPTLAEAVTAAAVAAQASAKKEKERMKEKEKESRVAGKGPLMVSKKKISSAMNQWKQRQSETQAVQGPPHNASSFASAVVPSDVQKDTNPSTTATYGGVASHQTSSSKSKLGNLVKDSWGSSLGRGVSPISGVVHTVVGAGRAKPVVINNNSVNSIPRATTTATSSVSIGGLGRGSIKEAGRGSIESVGPLNTVRLSEAAGTTPFKTNAAALGSYGPLAGTKRRFTETPQTGYRDRAAERRSLFGSAVLGETVLEVDPKEKGLGAKGRALDMPFPPGVGAKSSGNGALGGPEAQSFEVVTTEKAIDERNVGNRMLRNMGWQEGSGLGKGGTGIVEPVQAQGTGERAGLGSGSQRKMDSRFETQPGDTYRVVIQKKALARFHEMI